MKKKQEHHVPLCDRALAILQTMVPRSDGFIFPGQKGGRITKDGLAVLLENMVQDKITVHGFRSTFSDWAGDKTDFDHTTIEFALAHGITDQTRAAYRRGTAIEKRRRLMQAWSSYCNGTSADFGEIIQMPQRG